MKVKENRVKQVVVNLTETDYGTFLNGYETTMHRSLSAYGARLLLGKPVKVIVRNRSIDDLIELGGKLRKDLKDLLAKDSLTLSEKEALRQSLQSIENNLIKLVTLCSQD